MLLDLSKERAQTLVELKASIEKITNTPTSYDRKGSKKFIKEGIIDILNLYCDLLETTEHELHLAIDYEAITKPFIEENELKMPQLFQPIRIALTGGTQAPSVYDIMAILGKEETLKRIKSAIAANFGKEEE